jgi:hypothetical protein
MTLIQFKRRITAIKLKHRTDFGHDWYVQILNTSKHWPKFLKRRSLIQISVSWNDQASWPFIQIQSGGGSVFSILLWVYKFGFDVDLFSSTWNFERLEELDKTLNEQE